VTEPSKLFGQPRTTMAYSEIRAATCMHRQLVTLLIGYSRELCIYNYAYICFDILTYINNIIYIIYIISYWKLQPTAGKSINQLV
jgi:hypothetical protein